MNETISNIVHNSMNDWASVSITLAMLATAVSAVVSLGVAAVKRKFRSLTS